MGPSTTCEACEEADSLSIITSDSGVAVEKRSARREVSNRALGTSPRARRQAREVMTASQLPVTVRSQLNPLIRTKKRKFRIKPEYAAGTRRRSEGCARGPRRQQRRSWVTVPRKMAPLPVGHLRTPPAAAPCKPSCNQQWCVTKQHPRELLSHRVLRVRVGVAR